MRYTIKLLVVALLFWGNFLYGSTITICADCEVSSISEGVKIAAEYDTLLIKKGTYKEFNILIDKPLILLGENYPIIDGEDQGEIIRIVSDNVTVDGLFIINVGTSYTTDYAAIRVVKSEHFLIQNVVLEKLFFGIYLEKSNNGKVYHNKIIGDAIDEYNSGNGIQLWYSKMSWLKKISYKMCEMAFIWNSLITLPLPTTPVRIICVTDSILCFPMMMCI